MMGIGFFELGGGRGCGLLEPRGDDDFTREPRQPEKLVEVYDF